MAMDSMTMSDNALRKPGLLGIVWTRRRRTILAVLVIGTLLESSCYALMAPFFPDEAKSKGNSATQFGIIFGTYPLVGFVFSPICGKLLATRVNPKTMLIAGILIDGLFLTMMGGLRYVNDATWFFALGFGIRFIEAIGFSASITCYYAIASSEFSERVHLFVPLIETIFGVGLMMGPALGGAMFEIGGYTLPFFTFGFLTIVFGIITIMFLPTLKTQDEVPSKGLKDLYLPQVILDYMMVVVCFIIIGFNEATLAIHLHKFGLSEALTGACFVVPGGIYAIFSITWGSFCRRVPDARYFVLFGGAAVVIALLILGPVPWLNFAPKLWIVLVSQGLIGFGDGAMYVCSFMHTLSFLIKRKDFEDDFSTYALLAGLFSSAFSLGGFAGPILGGVLIDYRGYEYATGWIVFILAVALACIGASVTRDFYLKIDLRDDHLKAKKKSLPSSRKGDAEHASSPAPTNGHVKPAPTSSVITPEDDVKPPCYSNAAMEEVTRL